MADKRTCRYSVTDLKTKDNGGLKPTSIENSTFCVPPTSKQPDVDASSVDSLLSSDDRQPPKVCRNRSRKKRQADPDLVFHVRETRYCPGCLRSLDLVANRYQDPVALTLGQLRRWALQSCIILIGAMFLLLLAVILCHMEENAHNAADVKFGRGNNTRE